MKTTPVDAWYAVEWSPMGGMKLTPVREMFERNQMQFMGGECPAELDYRPLWIFPSMEIAEAFRAEARTERRRRREEKGKEDGDGAAKSSDGVSIGSGGSL